MKKTAVLLYNQFCNFEIAPALEMLAMAEKPITIFAKSLAPVRSEEGLKVFPYIQTAIALDLGDIETGHFQSVVFQNIRLNLVIGRTALKAG